MPNNDAFIASIEQATTQIIQERVQCMEKACLLVVREAKKNAPVDMGTLRAAITHDVAFDSLSITGRILCNLDYAPFVHQGTGIYAKDGTGRMTPWSYCVKAGNDEEWYTTRGQKPQPFLEDAKLNNLSKIERILAGK